MQQFVKSLLFITMLLSMIFTDTNAYAHIEWDFYNDYSKTNNPNEAWSYGRKWTVVGTDFDLFTTSWGSSGWFMNNWGHGGPSVQLFEEVKGIDMWAKDNSNGYPVVRWTSPKSGKYDINGKFTGADSRGVDTLVYVVINGSTKFSGAIKANEEVSGFFLSQVELTKGDTVDFVVVYNGGVYSGYNWTAVSGKITNQN